jgi:hypothetical protein
VRVTSRSDAGAVQHLLHRDVREQLQVHQFDKYAHLFGMVLVGRALWFVIVGALLWRTRSK